MNGGTGKTSYAINSRLAVSLFKGFFFFFCRRRLIRFYFLRNLDMEILLILCCREP